MLKLMDFYLLSKNIVKNISENISGKCSQNLLNNAKESDLIENKFADKIMGTSSESVPETAPRKTKGIEFDDENQ